MHYTDILAKFLELFPNYKNKIRVWTPNGHESIKVDTYGKQTLEFSYHSDSDWTLLSYTGKHWRG